MAISPNISIHAPARGATGSQASLKFRIWYFNSRPCERGDRGLPLGSTAIRISIHAPARGATCFAGLAKAKFVFQFTPLREGRPALSLSRRYASNFNSRPCERGDGEQRMGGLQVVKISIHAPARGATRPARYLHRDLGYFNSRPCERGDYFQRVMPATTIIFQFTPLREGRRGAGPPCPGR